MKEAIMTGLATIIGATAAAAIGVIHKGADLYIKLTSKPPKQRKKDVNDWLNFDGAV